MWNKILNIAKSNVFLTGVLFVGFYFYMEHKNAETIKQIQSSYTALADSTKHSIDKFGDHVAMTPQASFSDKNIVIKMNPGNDAELKRLQEELKKYKNGSAVTVFGSTTKIDTTLTTKISGNAIEANASDGKWYEIKNTIVPDGVSTTHVAIKDELAIVYTKENGKNVAIVKNKNPYSTTGEIKSFVPAQKESDQITFGVGVGYAFDGKLRPELQLHYKLFGIK